MEAKPSSFGKLTRNATIIRAITFIIHSNLWLIRIPIYTAHVIYLNQFSSQAHIKKRPSYNVNNIIMDCVTQG